MARLCANTPHIDLGKGGEENVVTERQTDTHHHPVRSRRPTSLLFQASGVHLRLTSPISSSPPTKPRLAYFHILSLPSASLLLYLLSSSPAGPRKPLKDIPRGRGPD